MASGLRPEAPARVWLHAVPPGTPPVPVPLRNLGRVGRLRWLTGKRSAEENWDAFEALNGRPFVEMTGSPQPWREVRYWLYDLATEISAAEREGALPELVFDRIWITGEGRAKLLDFPGPGLARKSEGRNPKAESRPGAAPSDRRKAFLLGWRRRHWKGLGRQAQRPRATWRCRCRCTRGTFLKGLSQMPGIDAVAATLKPLLSRVAVVSRLRRAAFGCGLYCLSGYRERSCAGLMDDLLARAFPEESWPHGTEHAAANAHGRGRFWGGKNAQLPANRLFAIYIAHHFSGLITNAAAWSSPMVLSMIKWDARKFAERSVAEHPAPAGNGDQRSRRRSGQVHAEGAGLRPETIARNARP